MKTKVEFECIKYNGQFCKIIEEIEHPEFTETCTETCTEQIIDFLDNATDMKSKLMSDYDLTTIMTYTPVTDEYVKLLSITMIDILKDFYRLSNNEKLTTDLLAIYTRLKPTIDTLPVIKQYQIILDTAGIAYDSASAAYQHMYDFSKAADELLSSTKGHRKIKYGKVIMPTIQEINEHITKLNKI